jgi:putative SOS response-associated peptidase YedK
MCGRITVRTPVHTIVNLFDIEENHAEPAEPHYNIPPGQEILVVRRSPSTNRRELTAALWGLIPYWATDPKIGFRMINARVETLADKPAYRQAFKKRRCLIPADGFYEWKNKQPYFIHRPDDSVFAFAGLWETWKSPKGHEIVSCTIVTTAANAFLMPLHERMPVILAQSDYGRWLGEGEILPGPPLGKEGVLEAYPVSMLVNRAENDDPACVVPIGERLSMN